MAHTVVVFRLRVAALCGGEGLLGIGDFNAERKPGAVPLLGQAQRLGRFVDDHPGRPDLPARLVFGVKLLLDVLRGV